VSRNGASLNSGGTFLLVNSYQGAEICDFQALLSRDYDRYDLGQDFRFPFFSISLVCISRAPVMCQIFF
jgi:hypothetical protein